MPFYKLTVAYDGTDYHGFQRQIDNVTMDGRYRSAGMTPVLALTLAKKRHRGADNLSIQEILESAILHLFPSITSVAEIRLRFAGRTDKGVHAAGQVVQIYLPSSMQAWMLRRSLNSRLPHSVSVDLAEPTIEFDPRKDCVRKVYEYSIRFRCYDPRLAEKAQQGTPALRSALDNTNRLWICPWALEFASLTQVCRELQGTHDYSNFVHKEDRGRDHTMTIEEVTFVKDHEKTEMMVADEGSDNDCKRIASRIITGRFRLTASSFRRSMVRLIVQFCVDASRIPAVVSTDDAFTAKEGKNTIRTAPACGLCLVSVAY